MPSARHVVAHLAVVLAAASALAAPVRAGGPLTVTLAAPFSPEARPEAGKHVLTITPDGLGCRVATPEEARSMFARSGEPLHVIKGARTDKTSTGLTIILRSTSQLDGFPAAKNAFLAAAAEWESRVMNPITVIVDVDFGPKRFGVPYEDPDIIGSTDTQELIFRNQYSAFRSALLSHTSGASETALYNSLPSSSVPTDIGATSNVLISSANGRALGALRSVPDPTGSESNIGDPPSIGFNSSQEYDFDPSNGIDFSRLDFTAAALHEIGHVLGFDSNTGFKELYPHDDAGVTVLDLFRFRPGATMGTFASASRIQSSGGAQVFFAGGPQLELSTGRPDGTGGDGEQASHWKDDAQTGVFIGLMDPRIPYGQREDLTANDLAAFDVIGYRFSTGSSGVTLANLAGNLVGGTLTITGTGQSASPITLASVTLLDPNGSAITDLPNTPLSIGTSGTFTLVFNTLDDVPAATSARIVLSDNAGNTSAATAVDFSGAETGGPVVTKTKIKGTKLKLTGTGFASSMQLEVNGRATALPPGSTVNAFGKKAKIQLSGVSLRNGANRVRLLVGGRHSNIVILTVS